MPSSDILAVVVVVAALAAHAVAQSDSPGAFLAPSKAANSTPASNASGPAASSEEIWQAFERFEADFDKRYAAAERQARFEAFRRNWLFIRAENLKNHSYILRLNAYSDLATEELLVDDGSTLAKPTKGPNGTSLDDPVTAEVKELLSAMEPPPSVDWKAKGAVTPVLDQGMLLGGGSSSCGSCFAFAAAGAVASAYQIMSGNLVMLSEQQLIDCTGGSCSSGGVHFKTVAYAASHALCTRQSYPYTGMDAETCSESQCAVALPLGSVSEAASVPFTSYADEQNEQLLMQRLAIQPVSVSLWASNSFKGYGGGVFTGPCDSGGSSIHNHAVLFVGYGTTADGQKYWLLKNSWGLSWGEVGYMKLARAMGQRGLGLCNVYSSASYPVMSQELSTAPPSSSYMPTPPPQTTAAPSPASCCSVCQGTGLNFCSPNSNTCYAWKRKDYYETCPTSAVPTPESCCLGCQGSGLSYCSQVSQNCYSWKRKDYYESCSDSAPASPETPQGCCSACRYSAFCSPSSRSCYSWKKKDYYETCQH